MMQSRRRERAGSSGELDVFGATSYFAGLPPAASDDCCRRLSSATQPSSADRLYFQPKVVQRDTTTTERDHTERHATNKLQVVAAKRLPSSGQSKLKLAALLSFMVAPSPRSSFRKEKKKQEAPSSSTRPRQAEAASAAGGGEKETAAGNTYKAANSPSSSSRESISMQLRGLSFGAHDDGDDDDGELDLGVATGDRRLQGITVLRGIGGGEERWVVRCVPGPGGVVWDDEEHREKMLDVDAAKSASSEQQNIKDEQMVEVEQRHDDDGGNNNIDSAYSWDSDSSSDLFDLDLEY